MDSPKQLHPAWAPGSSQMFPEEHSQEGSAAVQTMSEVLVKNLSKLTLDPSIKLPSPLPEYPPQQQEREKKPQGLVDRILSNNRKRSGVRTLLTARKERMERMIPLIQYQRYVNKRSMLQKDLLEQEIEKEPAMLCGQNPEQSNRNHHEDERRKEKWREKEEKEERFVSKPLMDTLWAMFKLNKCPTRRDRQSLAFEFNMTVEQINQWFHKRRRRYNKDMYKQKYPRGKKISKR
ncbi:unnamed protein product [Nyctereutes procyonoides]|uniref:(raccoon dog) hypothetical protein n=2 Tax=Nyctereutes procyonoides TaxID=34880 RepID=A0A811YPP8_NYCPR|nr:unnamed protein product [Nyctereutes procyonoides]